MKKMKKLYNIVTILMIAMMIISIATSVFALKDPTNMKGTDTSAFDNIGKRIIGGIQAIGSIASVAILVVLGLKYMMGSTEEKAEYKKTMIPYIVGAILIFAASNIASMVFKFASSIS